MPDKPTMITKESLAKVSQKKKGMSKCNTKGVWVNSNTLYPCDSKHPDAVHFDSWLELKVYSELIALFGVCGVERQKPIFITHDSEYGIELAWRPDFYIPCMNRYIEVKGEWINNPANKADKTLFVWQYVTAVGIAGCDVMVVGESDFQVSKITGHDYRKLSALLF